VTGRQAKRENGGLGQDPPGSSMTGFLRESPSLRPSVARLGSPTSDSAPSEARKRGSGGGSPRKIDEWFSEGILPADPL
jgi:hypothetical protein